MSIVEIIKQPIWGNLIKHFEFLKNQRKNTKDIEERIGINWAMIIALACYLEGKIEADLKNLLWHRIGTLGAIQIDNFYQRRSHNVFIHRIRDYLEDQISKNTGVENIDNIIYLLSWKNVPKKITKFYDWEGIKILFQFRNVLAHGREISVRKTTAQWLEQGPIIDFKGGYRKTEDYLCKKGLTTRKVLKSHSIRHLFTNKVVDHFYLITKKFKKYFDGIIKEEKKKFDIFDIDKNV